MVPGGGTTKIDDLVKPSAMILPPDDAQNPHGVCRATVAAGLSLHKDKLDVILDDGVRFVRFAQK